MLVASDSDSMDEFIRQLEKEELKIVISKEIRRYKPVTVIAGLQARRDAEDIARKMKTKIGTGGTFKEGKIMLQGDQRQTARSMLLEMGFAQDSIEVL